MDGGITKTVLQYAGLAGLVVLVFYYLVRDIVNRKVLVSLSREHSYRLLRWCLFAIWSMAMLAIAGHFYSGGDRRVEAQPAAVPNPGSGDDGTPVSTTPGRSRTPRDAAPALPPPSAPPKSAPVDVQADNVAVRIGPQQWQWKVFIVTDAATQARIECVEYTLHETFGAGRFNRVCDPSDRFALTATGWGVFDIPIRVIFRDGTEQHLTHRLRF